MARRRLEQVSAEAVEAGRCQGIWIGARQRLRQGCDPVGEDAVGRPAHGGRWICRGLFEELGPQRRGAQGGLHHADPTVHLGIWIHPPAPFGTATKADSPVGVIILFTAAPTPR